MRVTSVLNTVTRLDIPSIQPNTNTSDFRILGYTCVLQVGVQFGKWLACLVCSVLSVVVRAFEAEEALLKYT